MGIWNPDVLYKADLILGKGGMPASYFNRKIIESLMFVMPADLIIQPTLINFLKPLKA